ESFSRRLSDYGTSNDLARPNRGRFPFSAVALAAPLSSLVCACFSSTPRRITAPVTIFFRPARERRLQTICFDRHLQRFCRLGPCSCRAFCTSYSSTLREDLRP